MLKLFYTPGACSISPHICLEESGIAYESELIVISKGENRTPEYLAIHPLGRIPALQLEDGTTLIENTAILPYLGKRFGLWPETLLEEARALSVVGFFASNLHPALAHVARPGRYASELSSQEDVREMGYKSLAAQLEIMEEMLGDKDWFAGDYSVLDAYAFFFVSWIIRHKVPNAQYARLHAFKDRMLERDAVRRVIELENLDLS